MLAGLDKNEVNHLYKRAAMMRKARAARVKTSRFEGDEDGPILVRGPRSESLDEVVLRLLRESKPEPQLRMTSSRDGLVVQVSKRMCTVLVDGAEVSCALSPELARTQQTSIAVGDEVVVATYAGSDDLVVDSVRPRRTALSRPDPGNPNIERVIVANVDLIGVVVSLKTPPLHPRIIDRYLIAIQRGGAEPLLVVNKLDLASPSDRKIELGKLEPYTAAGVGTVYCSADSGEGMPALRERLKGKLCAFVGHSGVGKSSLLNALKPELDLKAKAVSEGYGRGTHTTTASTLYDLGDGTRIIDTPGIRSFGLWKLEPDELQWYFPEFAEWSQQCKFRDCTHSHEPECGVRRAAEEGRINCARHETYRRLLNP